MFSSTSTKDHSGSAAAELIIPIIRTAATIAFAIAPCSLGFVIIAVSEHVIRSIMVADDPEILVSDLQNQFPNDAIELMEHDEAGLIAKVVEAIEHPQEGQEVPLEVGGTDFQMRVWEALQKVPASSTASYTFLAEKIGVAKCVEA